MFDPTLLSRLAHLVCSCAPNRFDLFKSGVARRNVPSEYFYGSKSGSWGDKRSRLAFGWNLKRSVVELLSRMFE
jgi:hypothetical protein